MRDDDTWTNSYDISAASDGSASPVTIWIEDNIGNSAFAAFEYGLDNTGPDITFLSPVAFEVLRGEVLVRASVVEQETEVKSVQISVDAVGPLQDMFFDGQEYFFVISTALFSDGSHRLIIRAADAVGNVRAAGIDIIFNNSMPTPADNADPLVIFVNPPEGSTVDGLAVVRVSASDDSGITSVSLEISGNVVTMAYNMQTGYYEYTFDSTLLPDGELIVTATATDGSGRSAEATISFNIANQIPTATLALRFLQENAILLLIVLLIVFFVMGVRLLRGGRAYERYEQPEQPVQYEQPRPPEPPSDE